MPVTTLSVQFDMYGSDAAFGWWANQGTFATTVAGTTGAFGTVQPGGGAGNVGTLVIPVTVVGGTLPNPDYSITPGPNYGVNVRGTGWHHIDLVYEYLSHSVIPGTPSWDYDLWQITLDVDGSNVSIEQTGFASEIGGGPAFYPRFTSISSWFNQNAGEYVDNLLIGSTFSNFSSGALPPFTQSGTQWEVVLGPSGGGGGSGGGGISGVAITGSPVEGSTLHAVVS